LRALTLMYHDVVDDQGSPGGAGKPDWLASGFPDPDGFSYKLATREFAAHLAAIAALGRKTTLATQLAEIPPGLTVHSDADPPLLITFDDGGRSAMEAAELLEQHGFRGHFFVASNWLGTPAFLNAGQARDLVARGHVIGSHSATHPLRMGALPEEKIREEWTKSMAVLGEALGQKVRTASVPGGHYNEKVGRAAAAAGLEVLFNSEPTSRLQRVGRLLVIGRYTIQRPIDAATVAALARGDLLPRARQAAWWNAKKLPKRLGGEAFLAVRRRLLK
jgi:peptidoglycan/xylan/chitin deacetylase (PgdA/CDA1 family)